MHDNDIEEIPKLTLYALTYTQIVKNDNLLTSKKTTVKKLF